MKGGFRKFREFIERFYPEKPFTISISFFRIVILLIILGAAGGILYLRSQNKNELELLEARHHEMQMVLSKYLKSMSEVNINSNGQQELKNQIGDFQRKLKIVEEDIKHIKKVWFLE